MDSLPQYYVGYVPEMKTVTAVRADAGPRVGRDLQELFGGRALDLNFNVFANIQFMTRVGNDFGRAFWLYVESGPVQIMAGNAEHQHTYALLSMISADLINALLEKQFWPRVMALPLARNADAVNMLRGAGVIK